LLEAPPVAKRFLLYFAGLFAIMSFLGILSTRRAVLLGPWLILPIGVTLGSLSKPFARRALLASLVVIGTIGWYGIFARNLYAAPHWVEPWEKVSQQAAETDRDGGIVIGNNDSFFFYLTYLLPSTNTSRVVDFPGLLPYLVSHQGIYAPDQWLAAGHPTSKIVVLIKGMHFGIPNASTDEVESWLNSNCRTQNVNQLLHDDGAAWKQRYAPRLGELEWRIEVRTYACQ
jgi:hypothetical protein